MYTLIGSPRSRTFRVRWMLEELGEPYDYDPAGPRSDAVLAHNPSGKVPVLIAGDTALTDSTAILTFLADSHQAFTYPAGSLDRARQDGLTQMILDEMDAVLWTAARHSFILPEDRRVPEIKDSLRWEFAQACDRLAARLAGPFLMGEAMTVPDILAVHCLGWARVAKFDVPDGPLTGYFTALRARPAYQRAAA